MTLIVGMHLGTYALIAADTRLSFYPNGVFQYRDTRTKIRATSMGLIAGTGFTGLLDPVEKALDERAVTNTEEIVDVVRVEKTRALSKSWVSDPRVADGIESSAWFLTYLTPSQSAQQEPELRLATVGAHSDWRLALIGPGGGRTNKPTDASEGLISDQCRLLTEIVTPLDDLEGLADHLSLHLALCVTVFREVAAQCETVSPTFNAGLSTVAGKGVSETINAHDPPSSLKDITWADL